MTDPFQAPVLTVEQDDEDNFLMWTGVVVLDGKPFPWVTLAGPKFEMTSEGLATLTVSIPVRLRIVPRSKPW